MSTEMKVGKTFHVCLSVRGAIRWPDSKLRKMLMDENGDRVPPRQVRDWLMDQLAMGREVIPIGDACEGFDYKDGCQGHAAADVARAPRREGEQ